MTPGHPPRTGRPHAALHRARAQRGLTLFGLMFWALFIAFFAYLLVRTLPTVNEYMTIQRAVSKVAADAPQTVAETRQAFDRQKDVEYSITSITGKDLVITKENDKVVISFSYDKEVPIYGPVFLLVKYEGRSK
ncbi:MAG: DUF4845 domain-containing protein [Chitinophagaceae bacterium]|nr:DUF4845 domain-containing protein [Rubrivivax sp.]